MAAPLYTRDSDGNIVLVPEEERAQYHEVPSTPADQADISATKHPIKAAYEGFAKEATFGLATPVLKYLNSGEITPEELAARMRARAETGAYTAGQVGGFAAGALGGPAKLLAGGVKKIATGAVLRGALEGEALSVGQLVHEGTLSDQPMTAEHAAVIIGTGVLGGAVIGKATHAIAGLASGVAKKLSTASVEAVGKKAADALERGAYEKALSDEMLAHMREYSIRPPPGGKVDEGVLAHAVAVQESIKKEGAAHFGILDKIAPPKDATVGGLAERMLKEAKKLDNPNLEEAVQEVVKSVEDRARIPDLEGKVKLQTEAYKQEVAAAKAKYDAAVAKGQKGADVAYAEEVKAAEAEHKAALKEHEKASKAWEAEHGHVEKAGFTPEVPRPAAPEFSLPRQTPYVHPEEFAAPAFKMSEHAAELNRIKGSSKAGWSDLAAMDREIVAAGGKSHYLGIAEAAAEAAPAAAEAGKTANQRIGGSGVKAALEEAIGKYKVANQVVDVVENQVASNAAKTPDFLGVGAMLSGHPVAGAAKIAAGGFLKHRWRFMAADAVSGIRGSLLERIASGIRGKMEGLANVSGSDAFRVALEDAAVHGDAALFAEHARIMNSGAAPAYQRAMGLQPGPDAGDGAQVINALSSFTDSQNKTLDSHVGQFFGKEGAPPPLKVGTAKDFNEKMKNITAALNNPESLHEAIPGAMVGGAPMTSGMATQTALNAMRLLWQEAPKNPNAGLPPALARPWEPSKAQLAKWYRTLEAVQNPSAVVARAGNGTVDAQQLKVLKQVYPRIYGELQQKVMEKLAKGKVTNAQRSALQGLFGGPGMSQAQMKIVQQVHATVNDNNQPAAKPDGRQDRDVEKNMETQAQRLERR
jgi:hypothetical protein